MSSPSSGVSDRAVAANKRITLGPHAGFAGLNAIEARLVRECVGVWLEGPETRVTPHVTSAGALSPTVDPALGLLREEVDKLLRVRTGWLRKFDAVRMYEPSPGKEMLHSIPLDDLSVVEQVAVLQSVMVGAGISFVNLVPAFARSEPDFLTLAPPTVQMQLFEARWAITAMVARVEEMRRSLPAMPAPVTQLPASSFQQPALQHHDVDVRAMRKASSVISSSDWSQLQVSQPTHAAPVWRPQDQPVFGLNQLRVAREPAPPQFVAQPASFAQPAMFPHQARRSPTVDEPMEQAPEYYPSGIPFREPAPTASNNPPGIHQYQGQFGSVPAREPAQPLYARPFIPFNSMEKLSGTEPLSDRRVWWEEYKYLARAGG
ncbi:hypothetical protein ATCC90586_011123 [Pythium insidiosum]|nr:hypothetical protein ATCC90586_011123 [Pythium insidiosum]